MTIGQRISQYRKEMNLSQEQLGDKLGVSRQAVYKWESDLSLPDSNNLIELSKIFSIGLSELIGHDNHEEIDDIKSLSQTNSKSGGKSNKLLMVLLVGVLLVQIFIMSALKSRLSDLEEQVSYLENSNSVHYPTLPMAPTIFNEMEIRDGNYNAETMTMEKFFEFSLREDKIGSVVSLHLDEEVHVINRGEDGFYKAKLELGIKDYRTSKLVIEEGDTIYSHPLGDYTGEFNFSTFLTLPYLRHYGSNDKVYNFDLQYYFDDDYYNDNIETSQAFENLEIVFKDEMEKEILVLDVPLEIKPGSTNAILKYNLEDFELLEKGKTYNVDLRFDFDDAILVTIKQGKFEVRQYLYLDTIYDGGLTTSYSPLP